MLSLSLSSLSEMRVFIGGGGGDGIEGVFGSGLEEDKGREEKEKRRDVFLRGGEDARRSSISDCKPEPNRCNKKQENGFPAESSMTQIRLASM